MDLPTNSGPWFCPGCRRRGDGAAPPVQGLCEHCGERVVSQGYCPVCEDYQSLPEGAPCPKHDIPLVNAPPEPAPVEGLGPWVEVARYPDALDCQPPRIRLEGEGIPTVIQGERMGSRSMYQVATGGVSLRVPEGLAAEARVILSQTWSRDAAELGIEEDDWDEGGLGAERSSMSLFGRSVVRIGLLAEAGAVLIVLVVLLWRLVAR